VAGVFPAKDADDAFDRERQAGLGLGRAPWTNDKNERERFINDLGIWNGFHKS